MHTNIKSYLDIVCEQIRYEKAHTIIKKELEEHITDQTDAFIAKGMEQAGSPWSSRKTSQL